MLKGRVAGRRSLVGDPLDESVRLSGLRWLRNMPGVEHQNSGPAANAMGVVGTFSLGAPISARGLFFFAILALTCISLSPFPDLGDARLRDNLKRTRRSFGSPGRWRLCFRPLRDRLAYRQAVFCQAAPSMPALLYPVHATTRKSLGDMTRKLSVTESRRSAQRRGTFSRRKSSVASANWAHVA